MQNRHAMQQGAALPAPCCFLRVDRCLGGPTSGKRDRLTAGVGGVGGARVDWAGD